MSVEKFDVVIVGARVAGAATALQFASAGLSVLIVDRAAQIGDTLSTHALMRPAVMLLDTWGLARPLVDQGAAVVSQTTFQYGAEKVVIPIKPGHSVDGLIAPRRELLDNALLQAAVDAGAELRLGTGFQGVEPGATGSASIVRLLDRSGASTAVECGLLVGADGRNSVVAEAVNAATMAKTPRGGATIFGYFDGAPNGGYHWMFSKDTQAGLIPTDNGLHCVFFSCRPEDFRKRLKDDALMGLVDGIAEFAPEIAARLSQSTLVGKLHRFAGAPGHIRQATGKGWALVGDAGYFKDPATAHGITDALLDSFRLSRAILSGRLSDYEIARNRHAFKFLDLTFKIADLDWSMDQLKNYHTRISRIMKLEVAELADALTPDTQLRAA